MGVRWLVCNVRKGTRWLYRGYTWQRLVQSSVQSSARGSLQSPLKALHGAPPKLCTELHQSSARSSIKALHGAPPKLCTDHQALHGAPSKPCTEFHLSARQVSRMTY